MEIRKYYKDASIECHEKASQDLMRETMTIMVEGKPVTVYKDEIEKTFYQHLSPVHLEFGA